MAITVENDYDAAVNVAIDDMLAVAIEFSTPYSPLQERIDSDNNTLNVCIAYSINRDDSGTFSPDAYIAYRMSGIDDLLEPSELAGVDDRIDVNPARQSMMLSLLLDDVNRILDAAHRFHKPVPCYGFIIYDAVNDCIVDSSTVYEDDRPDGLWFDEYADMRLQSMLSSLNH